MSESLRRLAHLQHARAHLVPHRALVTKGLSVDRRKTLLDPLGGCGHAGEALLFPFTSLVSAPLSIPAPSRASQPAVPPLGLRPLCAAFSFTADRIDVACVCSHCSPYLFGRVTGLLFDYSLLCCTWLESIRVRSASGALHSSEGASCRHCGPGVVKLNSHRKAKWTGLLALCSFSLHSIRFLPV